LPFDLLPFDLLPFDLLPFDLLPFDLLPFDLFTYLHFNVSKFLHPCFTRERLGGKGYQLAQRHKLTEPRHGVPELGKID
jgi:hypothetical protein